MSTFQRVVAVVVALLWVPAALAVKIQFESDPAGATVRVVGPEEAARRLKVSSGTTPVTLDLPRGKVPWEVTFSRAGYETVRVLVDMRQGPRTIRESLAPLVVERQVAIASEPAGSEVLINGAVAGQTPLNHTFRFERTTSKDPWSRSTVRVRRPEYQDEERVVALDSLAPQGARLDVALSRIAEDREISISAVDEQGAVIPRAEVLVDGQPALATDERGLARVVLPFRRRDKTSPWSNFTVTVAVRNEYEPVARNIEVDTPLSQQYRLSLVTEVAVKRLFPTTEMTSRGPRIQIDQTEVLGLINDRDLNSPATELRMITNFDRRQAPPQAVNSFTVVADGRNIVFAVTQPGEDGRYSSNLFLKSVQSARSPVTQLTRGVRFLDSFPAISAEEGSTLVVFQSNRGVQDTWDLSAIRVENGRVVGGVQQLTRDPRFNVGPSIASEHQPVFFSSYDETPGSLPRISSVRPDGSTLTNYGEMGEQVNYGSTGLLYLMRPDTATTLPQIYSLAVDGQAFSTVLNDEQFSRARCAWPALNPSGDLLLFVSDYVPDEKGRRNNNIFLWDLRRGTLQQLTDNGSDDIMPRWSPTEPGVIYFLSNRQGVYNVWRMSFRLAQ